MRLLIIVTSVMALWNIVKVAAGVETPIFVVAQYDMRPALNLGDVILM